MELTRRQVLKIGAGGVFATLFPGAAAASSKRGTRFGVIADVHHGVLPDATTRLSAFILEAGRRDLDFVLQLGDFNHPTKEARAFLDAWSDYRGPRYGVLGNHDMDLGTKEDAVAWWGIPGRYYSFDTGETHVVVLDANNIYDSGQYVAYANGNYFVTSARNSYIDQDQLDWLVKDLASTSKRTVVFVHQAIDETGTGGACQNRHRVRAVLEEANRRAGFTKVAAVFQGHHHTDEHQFRRGIHYVRVNSASYHWVGEKYGTTAPYTEPLYCFVTVKNDEIVIEGRSGGWVSPTPQERGVPGAEKLSASITGRGLEIAP